LNVSIKNYNKKDYIKKGKKMEVTWIMETNLGLFSDIEQYVQGVKDSGAKVISVKHVPFREEVPEIGIDGPFVVYGSVNFINLMRKSDKYLDGIFGDENTFTYENWSHNYGDYLLNSPDSIKMMKVKDIEKENREDDEYVFVRPQHDTKSLVGTVWKFKELNEWSKEASKGVFAGINGETEIILAKPYGIDGEWRLFVGDNKIIGASQYQKNKRLYKSEGAPKEVIDFAQKCIEKWNPAKVYTLDLCKSANNYYIVEAQGFNSAGHYASDIKKVAEEVNKIAIQIYKSKNHKKLKI
jgi:hypothetical protein